MLERHQFIYILDRACAQFEPDDPQYIRVCRAVYDKINQLSWTPLHGDSGDLNPLRSLRHTRHFGPLALYMIVELSNPGPLVYETLYCQHFARLGWLLQLIALLQPESKFSQEYDRYPSSTPFLSTEVDPGEVSSDQAELSLNPTDVLHVLNLAEVSWTPDRGIECSDLLLHAIHLSNMRYAREKNQRLKVQVHLVKPSEECD